MPTEKIEMWPLFTRVRSQNQSVGFWSTLEGPFSLSFPECLPVIIAFDKASRRASVDPKNTLYL